VTKLNVVILFGSKTKNTDIAKKAMASIFNVAGEQKDI
jgi:hypothetical protein